MYIDNIKNAFNSLRYGPSLVDVWGVREDSPHNIQNVTFIHSSLRTSYVEAETSISETNIKNSFSFQQGYLAEFYAVCTYD